MNLQHLYAERLNFKFDLGLPHRDMGAFEYASCDDGSIELFPVGGDGDFFANWMTELWPPDPRYGDPGDRRPILHRTFPQLGVYDEQVLNFLLYTLNATLSLPPLSPYHAMNERMKQYAFFRLARLSALSPENAERKDSLRDFLFWFYLYAHPVNGDTLEAFSFRGASASGQAELIHTESGVSVRDYFRAYHDYYAERHEAFEERLTLGPEEIRACGNLTLLLLDALEGRPSTETDMPMLPTLPGHPELDAAISLIHSPGGLLSEYTRGRSAVFEVMGRLFETSPSTDDMVKETSSIANDGAAPARSSYHDYIAGMLLDDYICCVLHVDFDEIFRLIAHFEPAPALRTKIVSSLFADTIFLQKRLRQQGIDLVSDYPEVTACFDENARRMWGVQR
ncbi:hypothetical protein [Saccharibacillus alkalitolerans]|uniref:Uncharacterized protein n=1 Tax=Saccharibacillus alkalitolerans TaxID=2705290 RepID=A0ABX0FBE5_9BACL|nr:hypothetical protein [Saccharibacillus alkalitolerans]NGZ76571.1 hypothetical protein [Saccharibacillus alkalitolerans]